MFRHNGPANHGLITKANTFIAVTRLMVKMKKCLFLLDYDSVQNLKNSNFSNNLLFFFYFYLSYLHFQQTLTHDSHLIRSHDRSHDKGQYPITTVPDYSNQTVQHFVDMSKARDLGHSAKDIDKTDQSFTLQDSDMSWPSDSPDGQSRPSVSPVRDSRAKMKDPSKIPVMSRPRSGRPVSASFKQEGSVSTLPKDTRFRSLYSRQRDRSWSPPSIRDRDSSPSRFRDKRLMPSPNKDFDSFSLPELPDRSAVFEKDSYTSPMPQVTGITTTATVISSTAAAVSIVTDSSSTLTSTITSPPTTQRDQKESLTLKSAPKIPTLGLSPPVRDSGSSLTTVTSLTDQAALSSARDSNPDRRRFSFDLGFLDILTIDSNSSVADQLSTGRVSGFLINKSLMLW